MAEYNGGFKSYSDRVTTKTFFRAEDRATKSSVIKSGQVLKKHSFLQSDATGKLIAHTGLAEGAIVKFATITTGQTLILGGLTFTAGTGSVTAVQLSAIWSGIAASTGFAAAAVAILAAGYDATVVGTFTAGTLTGWNTSAYGTDSTSFTSTAGLTNPTDLAATGTATAPSIAKVDGVTSFPAIAGVLLYDVDATSADVSAEVYTEASFWASALVWLANPNTDVITKADGSTVAVSAYNTGTIGATAAATKLLQQKFVEGSEFSDLGFLNVGEYL